jgi:hypothetical protein
VARPLRWSSPPPDIVKRLVAQQAITFWVEEMRMVRANRHAHFVFVPLADLEVVGGSAGGRVIPGATRDHWLVWQPLSSVGAITRLPAEPGALISSLQLPAIDPRARVYRAALEELIEALYVYRAV